MLRQTLWGCLCGVSRNSELCELGLRGTTVGMDRSAQIADGCVLSKLPAAVGERGDRAGCGKVASGRGRGRGLRQNTDLGAMQSTTGDRSAELRRVKRGA